MGYQEGEAKWIRSTGIFKEAENISTEMFLYSEI